MASIFTKIIRGEIPSHIVGETDKAFAFMDINPLVMGHTLVVPKKEVDKIMDLPAEDYHALMDFAREIGQAMEQVYDCNRVGMSVIGLEVPHTHVHLIPINSMDDMNFARPKLSPTEEELAAAAERIKSALQNG